MLKQPHLTPMEQIVLELYDTSDYVDKPGDPSWINVLSFDFQNKGFRADQLPGVVSSLVKKGLVGTQGQGREQTIWRL
jgi:hypothetical protein